MEYLDEEFTQRNWKLYSIDEQERVYRRNNLEFFIIKKVEDDKINVSYPIKNSIYNYSTNVSSYRELNDYVLNKLDYI